MGAALSAFFGSSCPTVDTMQGVNLTEWTRATWYVQEQQVTQYLPTESNYCVAATYGFDGAKIQAAGFQIDPFYRGPVISVYNYANDNTVNGEPTNADGMILCARVPDSDDPSKLAVAPCFLPTFLAGPYWILKAKADAAGRYEWAIVVGGQPTEKMSDGLCTTKTSGTNNAGLWLFSRTRTVSPATKAEMYATLKEAGISRQRLNPVAQIGCNYTGAHLKP